MEGYYVDDVLLHMADTVEIDMICDAIFMHSNKAETQTPFNEILQREFGI